MDREPAWNENLGLILVSSAVSSVAVLLVVELLGLGGVSGLVALVVAFLLTFFACLVAIDRFVLPEGGP